MPADPDPNELAGALRMSIGLLVRQMRQAPLAGELTLPEISALTRLDRGGPTTSSALARIEQITAQSMGATLAALEARSLVERRPDPGDGRRVVLSITVAGLEVLRNKRNARTEQLATALATRFTRSELEQLTVAAPLIERLGQSL